MIMTYIYIYIYTYTYLLKLGADFTLNSVRKEQVNTLTYVVFPEGFAHNKKTSELSFHQHRFGNYLEGNVSPPTQLITLTKNRTALLVAGFNPLNIL